MIVFFDGVCGLCNGFVDVLVRFDHEQKLKFAPLQGLNAAKLLPTELARDLSALVALRPAAGAGQGTTEIFTADEAVIEIFVEMGGVFRILGRLMGLVPRALRLRIYQWVARSRYGWFGKWETCRIPTASERERFLD